MALPAVMDMVADSQGESGSGGSVLFNDISTSAKSNSIPDSAGSILFPSFGDPMIDVHLSQMQGVVGLVPQSTTTGGGGNGGGNNEYTPPFNYNGFSSGRN